MRLRLTAVAMLALAACEYQRSLPEDELALLERTGLSHPEVVAAIASAGRRVTPFYGSDESGAPQLTVGVSVDVSLGYAEALQAELRQALADHDVGVFYATQRFGLFGPDELAIIQSADPYEYLAVVRTNGASRGLSHDSVVARLRDWDERVGLDFIGGGHNWVLARIEGTGTERDQIIDEVFELCPDLLSDNPRLPTREELLQQMRETGRLWCWWRRETDSR